jgi:small-conductance mechanosensitive channel
MDTNTAISILSGQMTSNNNLNTALQLAIDALNASQDQQAQINDLQAQVATAQTAMPETATPDTATPDTATPDTTQ